MQKNSAKFAFFYALSLVALIFMTVSTGIIIFQIVNKNIADTLNQYMASYSSEALKFAISALIISAPIYYLTVRQIYKNLSSGALEKDSGIRKWLTYLILFIASVVMIGWLIGIVNSFLDGELTLKFSLKAVSALVIAAIVFSFYFYDIKREDVVNQKDVLIKIYLFGSLAIVLIVFIASLFTVESPTETRGRKLDQAALNDFSDIERAISDYYLDNQNLPKDLIELQKKSSYILENSLKDPETSVPYDYKIIDSTHYELCVTFRFSNIDKEKNLSYVEDNNLHNAGYQCIKKRVIERGVIREAAPMPAKVQD